MLIRLSVIGVSSLSLLSFPILAQADIFPEGTGNFFAQLPFVGVLVWLWLQTDKRQREENQNNREYMEHMLEVQREFFRESLLRSDESLKRADMRQNQMADRVELLTQQLAMNTSTLNEVTKVDDVVDQLLERIGGGGK